jgi:hypothetical protein
MLTFLELKSWIAQAIQPTADHIMALASSAIPSTAGS